MSLLLIKKWSKPIHSLLRRGAGGRGRTDTVSLPRDFESRASANSTTPAFKPLIYNITYFADCQENFMLLLT